MSLKSSVLKETNRYELTVEVDAEAFQKAVQSAYRKNVSKMNVPGFRKGKAPLHIIEKLYGEGVFYEDAINVVYPDALSGAVKEAGLEMINDKVDFDVVSIGKEGLTFTAVITVKPEIEVGEYKNLPVEKEVKQAADSDVDAELERVRQRNARQLSVEDRAAKLDDTVVIDFDGYKDGAPFEGGKAENFNLTLGSGQFIPGFEDQIVGKNIGEEFDVNVTFPEDYQAEDLAGQPVVFKVKLHEIKAKELPELDDEFAKDVSEFDTLAAYKEDIKTKMQAANDKQAEDDMENALITKIIEGIKGEIPEAMFENQIDNSVREFDYRLQSQGMNLKTYLQYTGMDADSFRKTFREQAERQVKIRLALEKIAELENLTASEEEIEAEYQKLADMYKMELDKVKNLVASEDLMKDLSVQKAVDLVKGSAVVSEKKEKKAPAKKSAAKAEKAEESAPAKKAPAKKAAAKKPAAKKEEKAE